MKINHLQKFKLKLKKAQQNQFIRNLGWLSGAEVIIRISRLLTTIVLARFFTRYDYGLAAIVLTTYSFTEVLSRNGIKAQLIQVEENDLEALCNSAYWLNWLIFLGLFILQCAAAFPIAWFYGDNALILPICVMSIIYLFRPLYGIQFALTLRANRFQIRGISDVVCLATSNFITLILAFLGWGIWAIVVAKIIVAPLRAMFFIFSCPWKLTSNFTTDQWGNMFNFSRNILGVELLETLRENLDYLLIGRFLGIQELGVYYFAFNAGLGISLSITNAVKSAILPHLCALRGNLRQLKQQFLKSLKIIALVIIPLVLLQSSLAPIYVPIVFGHQWIEAIPILIIICLSAIPRPFAQAASQLLITIGKPNLDLRWGLLFTTIFSLALLVGVQWQAIGVAITVLLVHLIALPLFVVWVNRYLWRLS